MTSRYSSRDDIISSFSLPSHFYSTASRRPTITPVATREGKQVDDPSPNDINLSFLRHRNSVAFFVLFTCHCCCTMQSCDFIMPRHALFPLTATTGKYKHVNERKKERKKSRLESFDKETMSPLATEWRDELKQNKTVAVVAC